MKDMVEYWRQRCAEKHEELDRCKEERELYAKQQAIAFHRYFTGDKTNSDEDLAMDYDSFCKRQFIEKQNQNS